MKPRRLFYCFLSLALFLACTPAWSSPAEAPAHIAAEITDAHLAGQGNFRWFGLNIYEAQLWVSRQGFQSTAPTAARFALDLRYARAFAGKKISESSIDEIRKLGFGSSEQQRAWITQMESCFPNVVDGTHLTGIYLPDLGVRFYRDGKMMCEIKDSEFGLAFFAIWLDPRSSAADLREALLVHAKPH